MKQYKGEDLYQVLRSTDPTEGIDCDRLVNAQKFRKCECGSIATNILHEDTPHGRCKEKSHTLREQEGSRSRSAMRAKDLEERSDEAQRVLIDWLTEPRTIREQDEQEFPTAVIEQVTD